MRVVVAVVWAAFGLYWLVAAFSMKSGRAPWSRELVIRVVVAGIVLVLYRLGLFRHPGPKPGPWNAAVGLVVLALGLAVAVWARRELGRNWGMPMTEKREPELVTSGPYRFVRHPIYSGLLLAVVGTAIAVSLLWLVAALLAAVYFAYSARVEERYLGHRFPDSYPAYQRSTTMFVPFVV